MADKRTITTIRGRLLLLTLGLLIPGFLIGAYLLWDSYKNSRAAFDRQLLETARALSLVVDRELGQAAALIRALATSPYLSSGDLKAFDRQARELADGTSAWIVLYDEDGRQHINTHLPSGAELPVDRVNTEPLWRELRNRNSVVSNLFKGAAAEKSVITVSVPVEVDNRIRYGLAYVMLPAVFNKIMAEQKLAEGWNGTILDGTLSIVARSTGGDAVVGRKPSPVVAAQMAAQGESGVVESTNLEGTETVVAYSKSPLYRWTFGVSVPRAQVTAAITRSLAIAGAGGFAFLVLGALIAGRVARSISQPVESLAHAAQALGRGEPVMPPNTPIHEVNTAAKSIQAAAEELIARDADLRESEKRFRSMADTAPALIWMTDADGEIIFLNRYHQEFFGQPVEKLYGRDWRAVIHPDDLEVFFEEFQQAVHSRSMWRREVRVRDGQGSTRWLNCEGAPRFAGTKGEFLGYVGCNVDITESKLAADALERRIEERTGELATANRQLLAQIEERERVEETLRQVQRLEAVGQLTSGVAHDFNNLLTVILGNLSFAERNAKDGALKKQLSNMRMAAERGASLVAQLLAFSRRQRLEPKAVNLNETVSGMRELLQSSMSGSVAVDIVLEEDLWPALVDPTQIELIILNLAINARDAMDVGGLLTVATSNVTLHDEPARPEQPGPGDYVVVSVTDSGSGMSEDVIARVFEPFFTTKEIGKGSGLGLSQVLGFAKQSGGGVRIDTREGKGTTVCVYLPRATQDLPKTKKRIPRTSRATAANVSTILLVDDDDLVREVTASKLEEFGYKVLQAANGPSALLEFEKAGALDLLILDFAMPGMNGAEVARAARKRRPNLPVMFVTGYADLTALGEFADEQVLHKPFRDSELKRLVTDMLKAKNESTLASGD